jgi:hypothetical protein
VRTFDTIEELRAALVEFGTRYNETWLVARGPALLVPTPVVTTGQSLPKRSRTANGTRAPSSSS